MPPEPLQRRSVVPVFLVEGLAGLALLLVLTWTEREQTAAILHSLGPNAPILIAILAGFTAAMTLLRFELTEVIYVSLVATSCIAVFPLLGPVLGSWVALLASMTARLASLLRKPKRTFEEAVRIVPGLFAVYGVPLMAASWVYEAMGGELPLLHPTPQAALRAAVGGIVLIVMNNLMMFMPARTYGYSVPRVFRLYAIDSSIYLVTLPYAVVTSLAYGSIGWGGVLALAFTGAVANFVAGNLSLLRAKSQQQLQRLASLTNIGKTISLRYTTDQLLMAIYTECKKIVDCSLFTIALLDESTNELSFELDVRDHVFLPKDRIPVGEGLNSWVVKHHQPLLVGSVRDEKRFGVKAVQDTKKTESWLGVPMIARDRVIGVISVESYGKHAFTHDDMILMTAIANQAAVAIENQQLYKDLEGLTYALEARVMDRTNELREANLRLMAADRSKNQFLANMSHELRTPLNSIIGFSSVLLESTRNAIAPRFYKFLENIHAAGNHLLELINDILDLSKIEAGKMELRPDVFDLHETLAAVERVMKGFAAEANVRIVSFIDADVPKVRLDEGRLKQILFNLLSNAVKFSPNGGPVEVGVRRVPKALSPIGVDAVRIDVSDQGIGIQPDDLQRIFDEFYQTEQGRRSRRGGTGLGLSLTRNFVELHHGTIEVQSTPGQGSCFSLYLPVNYDESKPVPMMQPPRPTARAAPSA
ncbi:MAG: GAF domain-containing sensor histidine kinase [Acidobacteria bacterium]|nr:GAF domain-containing sensor histidine kinase [Acidobacteriota bacterium]